LGFADDCHVRLTVLEGLDYSTEIGVLMEVKRNFDLNLSLYKKLSYGLGFGRVKADQRLSQQVRYDV